MPNIETPEDEKILQFLNNLADYCIPMDGGKMRMTSQVWPIVKSRDAAIRAESAELLRVCGEALKAMAEPGTVSWGEIKRLTQVALAALKDAGVLK